MNELEEKTYNLYLFGFGSEDLPSFNLSLEKDALEELPTIKTLERYINNTYKYGVKYRARPSHIEQVDYFREVLEEKRASYNTIAKGIQNKHKNKLFKKILHKLERAKYYLKKNFSPEELKVLME